MINANTLLKHAEDAAFLWLRRDAAVRSNHYTLSEQQRLDDRVEAHLDGLRVAGVNGWEICAAQLADHPEPGEVFAAGATAIAAGDLLQIEHVLQVAYRSDDNARALVSALGFQRFQAIEPLCLRWLASQAAFENYLGIAGHAVQRRDPGAALEPLLFHPSARVRGRAIRAVAELGRVDLRDALLELTGDPQCSVEASLVLGRLGCAAPPVIAALERAVHSARHGWSAAALLAALQPQLLRERVLGWTRQGHLRAALAGVEGAGDLRFMPELLRWMGDDRVSRVAGEVFRCLTGVDLDYEDLERDAAQTQTDADHEDDAPDPGPHLDGEHELSWPAELSVARWWRVHQHEFEPGMRYLAGQPVGACGEATLDSAAWTRLCELVRTARPRQRALAAQRLQFARPGLPSVETHACAVRPHVLPGLAALVDGASTLPHRATSNLAGEGA